MARVVIDHITPPVVYEEPPERRYRDYIFKILTTWWKKRHIFCVRLGWVALGCIACFCIAVLNSMPPPPTPVYIPVPKLKWWQNIIEK